MMKVFPALFFNALILLIPLTDSFGQNASTSDEPGSLTLHYNRPASQWMTEALPIGNGPMGANQAFGDIFIRLGHDFSKVKNYKRQLDLETAIHRLDYDYEGVHFTQTALAAVYPMYVAKVEKKGRTKEELPMLAHPLMAN